MKRLIPWLTHHLQTPFVVAILLGMAYVLWAVQDMAEGARLFPQVAAAGGILLALLELGRQFMRRGAREAQDFSDLGSEDDTPAFYARGMLFFGWLAGYVLLFFALGPVPAAGLYLTLMLRLEFGTSWRSIAPLALGLMALVWVLGVVLRLRWPEPWLLPAL